MTKKLILIDGHALVHRAFHALPPTLVSPKGVLTNAVYGFTAVLIKAIKDIKPDYIAATFDLAGPTFRHEEFAEYKSHRVKAPEGLHEQVPIIKEVLTAFGIPIFEMEGFEADDLIGSIAEKAKKHPNLQTIIATGDLDTLQLVDDDKVVVLTLRKGVTDTVLYTEEEVKKRYGLKPSQLNDYRGLKGDPSDNIPGVPGIGEKTAAMLIQKFGNLENLYEGIAEIKNKKSKIKNKELSEKLVQKLLENKDIAFFSKKLSTIIKNVDVKFNLEESEWRKKINKEKLGQILKDLGFYSLIKRISELTGENEPEKEQLSMLGQIAVSGPKIIKLSTQKETEELFGKIAKKKIFALNIQGNEISIALDSKECFVADFNNIPMAEFKKIMENEDIKKKGHDFKQISRELLTQGIHIRGIEFDSKIAAYLLNSELKDYALEKIYYAESGSGQNIDSDFKKIPALVWELKERLWEKLKSKDLLWVFEKIELPLSPVLAEMELNGVKIDLKAIEVLAKSTNKQLADLEKKIYKLAGSEFNINSPQQLSVILFDKLKITGPPAGRAVRLKKTGKGAISTAASELEKLSGEHPIIELILKYRELQKLNTTYIAPFPQLVKNNGRLSTTFNQTGTTTGRLSSEEPNLQNIPIRTELGQQFRKAFIADKGYSLVSLDYSQLELRIAAHISKDKKMTGAFKRGEDIHTRTAAEIFSVSAEKVTAEMRRTAKVLNFGILYGMGILGFQRASKVSRERAREFIDRYMSEFSGVAEYMAKMRNKVHEDGYVATIFGRRRQFIEINSGLPQLVATAERMAINMPIQGTAADLLKLAMVKIYVLVHAEKTEKEIRLLLQVHDELLFEIKNGLIKEWADKIKEIMENIWKLDVPLTVDAKYGINWSEMKKV